MSDTMSAPRISASNTDEVDNLRKPRVSRTPHRPRLKRKSEYGSEKSIQDLSVRRNEDSFGVRITLIRLLLGQTQESFANLILSNRQAVAAMERSDCIDELSEGMVFRLYYFAKEITENTYISKDIKVRAEGILNEARTYISDRVD